MKTINEMKNENNQISMANLVINHGNQQNLA